MKVTRTSRVVMSVLVLLSYGVWLSAQQAAAVPVAKLVAEPASVSLRTGESVALKVTALDAAGKPIPDAVVRVNLPRNAGTFADGKVTAFRAGTFTATAVATGAGGTPVQLEIPVTVSWPALAKLEVMAEPGRLYSGITIAHRAVGTHADGSERPGLTPQWQSSDPAVARVDRFGNVTALKAGVRDDQRHGRWHAG